MDITATDGDLTLTVRAYYVGIDCATDLIIGNSADANTLKLYIYTYTDMNSNSTSSLITIAAGPQNGYGAGSSGAGAGGADTDGNSSKSDDSTKGIKSDSSITINCGTVYIDAPADDGLHVNSDQLDSGDYGDGDITINDGTITIKSGDDAMHADEDLTINDGTISITKSYEGIEGEVITVNGGKISVISSDDGMNAGTQLILSGGDIYVYAGGDGLDSNGTSNKTAILFQGANVAVIAYGNGECSIDTDSGYTYTSGKVIAVCYNHSMASESYDCSGSYTAKTMSSASNYLTASVSGTPQIAVKMPSSMSSVVVVYLGSTSASFSSSSTAPDGLTNTVGNLYV